ncbi:MAG: hypothetical protein DRJ98_08400 [Thermoprotei archaeon]|nr:MAG: hypothetical protein DRJ98_08400 [Thermoprotei archaeon]
MKELATLLPESKRKLLLYLCEHKDEFRLRTIRRISQEAHLAYITTKKVLREFEALGLVRVYVVGRAKVIVPTEKLKKMCETREVEK